MHRTLLTLLVISAVVLAVSLAQEPPAQEPPAEQPPPEQPPADQPQPGEQPGQPSAADKKDLAKLPLFEREPFHELYYQEKLTDPVEKVRIFPLKDIPKTPPKAEFLKVRLYSLEGDGVHGQEFQVLWRFVVKFTFFPEVLMEKAEELVSQKKFDEAYYYYEFLQQRYPDEEYVYYENQAKLYENGLPTLKKSTARYFYEEATAFLAKGDQDRAFTLLNDAYALNPEQPGLEAALAQAAGKRIGQYVDKGRFDLARTALALLEQRYPQNQTVVQWKERFSAEAGKLLAQADEHRQAGRLHEAREIAHASVDIWPLAEATSFLEDTQKQSPRVVVGVTGLPAAFDPASLDDWASRRAGRLIHRMLLEFSRDGPEGGVYICPFGELQDLPLDNLLVIHLNPGVRYTGLEGELTGADVARHLIAMAERGAFGSLSEPFFNRRWTDVFGGADLPRESTVEIRFRRSHVHPEGLLQTRVVPWDDLPADAKEVPTIGPFQLYEKTQNEFRYRANPDYFAAGPKQPKEIVERYYANGRDAFKDLRSGRIAVLDRVNPWNVGEVQGYDFLAVRRYTHPTVHCLRMNPQTALLKRRMMRRSIVHAIDRGGILQTLLGGPLVPGNQVAAAPFPSQLDPKVVPHEAMPALAYSLKNVAVAQENAARKTREEPLLDDENLQFTLAHPAHDLARVACRAIRDQLNVIGVTVNLREIEPGQPLEAGPYDLAYVELAVWEPLLDARRLFGEGGLAGDSTAFMRLALRDLDAAADWKTARAQLLEIYRLAHQDLPLLPLWELTEHYAYNKALVGLSESPTTLYQHVEQWESPPAVLPRE
jgi:hypothetical protein